MTAHLVHLGGGAYSLSGELNFQSVAVLWQTARAMFDEQAPATLDLNEVTRSDSSGVALLLAWLSDAKKRSQRQTLRFLNMPAQMQAITRVAELQHLLPTENSD